MKSTATDKIEDRTKMLEELAKQQGIKPVQDLEEIFKLWPEEADPDELLNFILSYRAEQRKLIRNSE